MSVHIGTRIFSWLWGEEVGHDGAGNRYFRMKRGGTLHPDSLRRERRWVLYNGEVEASRVPAEWHGWLHHTVEELPPQGGPPRHAWQQDHEPNRTGSGQAYRPPGHTLQGGRRDKATGDYEPWTPE